MEDIFEPLLCPICGKEYWSTECPHDFGQLIKDNDALIDERDLLLAKIETAKETLKFIGELPETNMGYWKIKAQEAYKQLEEK